MARVNYEKIKTPNKDRIILTAENGKVVATFTGKPHNVQQWLDKLRSGNIRRLTSS